MSSYPSIGRLDSLVIYADDFTDGKTIVYIIPILSLPENIIDYFTMCSFHVHCSKFELFDQKWIMQYILFSNINWKKLWLPRQRHSALRWINL